MSEVGDAKLVGIIGAGRLGQAMASTALRAGRDVMLANSLAADPRDSGGRRVIFLSGDDADAKSEVVQLFQDAGFFAVDLGELVAGGRMQQVGGPLAGLNLIRLP
jgi:predicted dinucleotide-binding enzyme